MIESKHTSAAAAATKRVLLVGHCGPDSNYLRGAVRSALPSAAVTLADDPKTLQDALDDGVDLVHFNRELGYDFDGTMGVDLIRTLKQQRPQLRTMLVTNYPDAQAAAIAAGAHPGFGKREIGSKRVVELLRDALK